MTTTTTITTTTAATMATAPATTLLLLLLLPRFGVAEIIGRQETLWQSAKVETMT